MPNDNEQSTILFIPFHFHSFSFNFKIQDQLNIFNHRSSEFLAMHKLFSSIPQSLWTKKLVTAKASGNASRLLHQTVLHDFHVLHGAKMVPFAGYSMPLMYGKVSMATVKIVSIFFK